MSAQASSQELGSPLGRDPGCCLSRNGKWEPPGSGSWVLLQARVTAPAYFQSHSPAHGPVQSGWVSLPLPFPRVPKQQERAAVDWPCLPGAHSGLAARLPSSELDDLMSSDNSSPLTR